MIEINLLPQEYRKKEPRFKGFDITQLNLQSIPIMHIIAGAVAVLVFAQATVMLLGVYGRAKVSRLTKEIAVLQPDKKTADSLKARAAENAKKIAVIDDLMFKRYSWAHKLNGLSDSMTPGIWLSEMSYDERQVEKYVPAPARQAQGKDAGEPPPMVRQVARNRILVIAGYAAGAGDQGTALVGKFIKSLKEAADFNADFSDIVLDSIRSDKADGQDVMAFRITCMFRDQGK